MLISRENILEQVNNNRLYLTMHWVLEHFQHMKQALDAINISNISVDEFGSTTRVSADLFTFTL